MAVCDPDEGMHRLFKGLLPEHVIAETGNIETTRAWDVDRDGRVEIDSPVPVVDGSTP